MSVLLPAPFSPSRAWTSPTRTSKSTPSLATTPGKRLTMPRRSTARAAGGAGGGWTSGARVMRRFGSAGMCEARDERIAAGLDLVGLTGRARAASPRFRRSTSTCRSCTRCRGRRAGTGRGRTARASRPRRGAACRCCPSSGPAKTSKRVNLPASMSARVSLTSLTSASREVLDAHARRLALHEAEEAHRAGVGVEVLVAGLVRAGLDLLGDPGVLGTPDPVRGGQAALDLAGVGVVVGDAPLALLLGDVGDRARVGAGEDDLGARVEERRGALLLLDRVVPGVDEPDVHRALGARLLHAAA